MWLQGRPWDGGGLSVGPVCSKPASRLQGQTVELRLHCKAHPAQIWVCVCGGGTALGVSQTLVRQGEQVTLPEHDSG